MVKGMPTPDNPTGDIVFECIPVYVPANPEFAGIFASAIYGLYAQMSKEYFWRELGTMSAQDAAFLSARGLAESQAYDGLCGGGGEMSCVDIADCIETDATVQEKLAENFTENATNNGIVPSPDTNLNESPPPTLKASDKSKNLLPASLDCETQPQIAMGLARAIVAELHQSAEDFFEFIEYATNGAEAVAMMVEQVPVIGNAASGALEFADWVIETMSETYMAAYNQSTEDELACMIFCHIIDGDCTLSINDLISLYEAKGTITVPPIDDIASVLNFATEIPLSADVICVAIFHYQILRLLSWGKFAGLSAAYLQSVMQTNVSASDYSYENLCDDCAVEVPKLYWRILADFRTGSKHGFVEYDTNTQFNNGFEVNLAVDSSATFANFEYRDLGAQYMIKAVANYSVRRGSQGGGSTDYANSSVWTGPNRTGTGSQWDGQGGITCQSNDCLYGAIKPGVILLSQSIAILSRVNRPTTSTVNPYLRVYWVSIIGEAGAGDTKPPNAHWYGDTLPTTLEEMFE